MACTPKDRLDELIWKKRFKQSLWTDLLCLDTTISKLTLVTSVRFAEILSSQYVAVSPALPSLLPIMQIGSTWYLMVMCLLRDGRFPPPPYISLMHWNQHKVDYVRPECFMINTLFHIAFNQEYVISKPARFCMSFARFHMTFVRPYIIMIRSYNKTSRC